MFLSYGHVYFTEIELWAMMNTDIKMVRREYNNKFCIFGIFMFRIVEFSKNDPKTNIINNYIPEFPGVVSFW